MKTSSGLVWFTVPVIHRTREQLILDTMIDNAQSWKETHLNLFFQNYRLAPFFTKALELIERIFTESTKTIDELDTVAIKIVCEYLGIETPLLRSSDLCVPGAKTDKLINLLDRVKATTYLSGPAAKAYLDESSFKEAGINLEYKTYVYPEYPQMWGPFQGAVTVLDLIANCGKDSRKYMTSAAPNELAVRAA